MVLALSRRQSGGTPLSVSQEQLLDDWVLGLLSAAEADQAAELTKRNGFAAERVLERRLLAAANEGPAVPSALASRVLKASRPRERSGSFRLRWPVFSAWQWSGLGAAVAATLMIAIIGLQSWQQRSQRPAVYTVQFAMVTIVDRSTLSGPRVRSLTTPSNRDGFQDVEVPADLVRRTIAETYSATPSIDHALWATFLPAGSETSASRTQVLVDNTLQDRLGGEWKTRSVFPVRIYDLDDPRWASIRSQVNPLPPGRLLLVTSRP